MRVALVYDRVNKWGGAERVLLVLHELFPDAPLYTSVYNSHTAPWAKIFPKVIPSFLQNFPLARARHDLYAPLMPIAFESFDFSQYDVVVSVTSEAGKGIVTQPATLHICYCLTPTRYLWSGHTEYFGNSVRRGLAEPAVSYLKKWDKVAAQRPDVMVAISKNVAERIRRYYGREARVIYPPVSLQSTVHSLLKNKRAVVRSQSAEDFFLVVSRLVPYKKVDLVVRVFNRLGLPLVVAGTGSEEKRLRKQSRPNIKFAGFVSDEELLKYYRGCKALIFPQDEDFGLVAIEAQAAGKPVIAYRAGGALETVSEGKTGIFFNEQSEEALIGAVSKFRPANFDPKACIRNAKRFEKKNFVKEFAKLVFTNG